jgi:hypothetical protein
MIQFLGLLKNPFVKIIADKTVGAISHKLEKDKIIKAKEIEAASKLDVAKVGVQLEQVRQQEHSIKDEILTIKISLIFLFIFLPFSQPYMEKGFEILKNAPVEFWYAVLIVYSGSFGISTMNKLKKKK